MVRIFCWNRDKITHARLPDINRMPDPYSVSSVAGIFPSDVRVLSRTQPRDFMEVGSFIFVSGKVKTILEAHDAHVEHHAVTLEYRGVEFPEWYYLHLRIELDCLDPEKTILAGRIPPLPEMMKHLGLKESVCGDTAMFRIAGTPDIGVSDLLAEAIRSHQCTGASFEKPEEWRNPAVHYE